MTSLLAREPDRMTGLPPGVAVAPLGRRFVAHVVDAIVPTVIGLVAFRPLGADGGSTVGTVVGSVLIALWAIAVWWMFATRAAGPGMRLMKLQLVGFLDGRPIGWFRFLLRAVVLGLLSASGIGLVLMLVVMLRHPRLQGWHDLASASVVIRARMLAPRSARPASAPAPSAGATPPVLDPSSAGAAPPRVPAPVPAPVSSPVPAPVSSPVAEPQPLPAVAAETAVAESPVPPAPDPTGAGGWVAELDDGRELAVTGLILLGRNPQARPGEEGAQLVQLSDESRTVSKSHLALDVDERGLFVVDRDSTNGSTFVTPTGEAFRCMPGQVTYVGDGAVVSIGDHRLRIRMAADKHDGEQSRPR